MNMTKRAPRATWAALGLATALLAGCGGGHTSDIVSAEMSPATVAAPAVGGFTPFTVSVRVKSRSSGTLMVTVDARTSSGWQRIGVGTCAHDQDCEAQPVVLTCFSNRLVSDSDRRELDCEGQDAPMMRSPGALPLRLELREYSIINGLSVFLEDSQELEGTLQ